MSVSAAGGSCRLVGLQTAKIKQESICQQLSVSTTTITSMAFLMYWEQLYCYLLLLLHLILPPVIDTASPALPHVLTQ